MVELCSLVPCLVAFFKNTQWYCPLRFLAGGRSSSQEQMSQKVRVPAICGRSEFKAVLQSGAKPLTADQDFFKIFRATPKKHPNSPNTPTEIETRPGRQARLTLTAHPPAHHPSRTAIRPATSEQAPAQRTRPTMECLGPRRGRKAQPSGARSSTSSRGHPGMPVSLPQHSYQRRLPPNSPLSCRVCDSHEPRQRPCAMLGVPPVH